MSSPRVRLWYALLVSFIACVAVAIGSVYYTSIVQQRAAHRAELAQQESDRRWCALLGDLDAAYQGPPRPTTELGRKVADEIHRLRVGFNCPAP